MNRWARSLHASGHAPERTAIDAARIASDVAGKSTLRLAHDWIEDAAPNLSATAVAYKSPCTDTTRRCAWEVYKAVIGYLLVHGERNELLYATAMALHFVANDQSLRAHHQQRYDRIGRWILAAAIIGGWAIALRWELPDLAVRLMIALLAGGVILNVLKEELPEKRESRCWAFLAGVGFMGPCC